MKYLNFLIVCSVLALSCSVAAAESTLVKIARADSKDIVQLFMTFDTTPRYTYRQINRRIDIIFENSVIPSTLDFFDPDDRIIKILPSSRAGRTALSLFFRYRPQKINVETSSDGKVVAEILLGNKYSRTYQDLSERLKGLTVLEREPAETTNPLLISPYKDNWEDFFRNYEAEIDISVPIEFTVPTFPVIALIPPGLEKNMEILPIEMYELAEQNLWDDMQPLILEQLRSTRDVTDQKLLALTFGESLFRNDDFEGAYKQLYLLNKEYPDEHIGIVSQYLLTLLEAKFQNPYTADYEFRELEPIITPTHPIAPYFLLSRIETALATNQYNRMKRLLDLDTVPFPGATLKMRELRLGDYYNATDEPLKSFVAYKLLKDTALLQSHAFSLNGFCNSLYKQRKYRLAAECYRDLGPQVSDNHALGLITYRKSMADLKYTPAYEMIDSFARIEDAFPGTEGGYRAALKRTDLKYLEDKGWANQAANYYRALAESSVSRSTVAEASLKEALIYSLLGDNERSTELLMRFLRNFQITELRQTALALLIDILPKEMKRHIAEGEFMKALVLAKQNRELFENDWLEVDLLADIANAYQKVGIFSEAQRVYLYLMEVVDVEKREKFYLPLIRSVFDQGEYSLVEDFASQYTYNYPGGKDTEEILALRIRALMAAEQFTSAKELIPDEQYESREIGILAANLFFRDSEYQRVLDSLAGLATNGEALGDDEYFLLAESSYQLNQPDRAWDLFSNLVGNDQYSEQALYRLAQIERSRGEDEKALKLFEKIVEIGNDTLWRKYAEKELEYSRLTERIDLMINQ